MREGNVMTVTGPVEIAEVGVVLPHEHVLIDLYTVNRAPVFLQDVRRMAFEVARFAQAGGKTLVEVTPRNVGEARRGSSASPTRRMSISSWARAGIESPGTNPRSSACPRLPAPNC
jgi:hypothetical protein